MFLNALHDEAGCGQHASCAATAAMGPRCPGHTGVRLHGMHPTMHTPLQANPILNTSFVTQARIHTLFDTDTPTAKLTCSSESPSQTSRLRLCDARYSANAMCASCAASAGLWPGSSGPTLPSSTCFTITPAHMCTRVYPRFCPIAHKRARANLACCCRCCC